MGTRFELVLDDDDPSRLGPIAERVLDEITRWHDRLSLFKRDSFLSYINAHAPHTPVPLEPELFDLFQVCLSVHRGSGGAFDPAVAPLMSALGLHKDAFGANQTGVERRGMAAVELDHDRRTIRFGSPGVVLDLGAVAKGFALDLAAAHLREFGIECALIHGGTSSIVAMGAPPDTDGWRIALGPDAEAPVILLRDAALSFSAPHGRAVETPDGGARATHILDPGTGAPASAGVFATAVVSVLTGAAADPWPSTRCEAWSTALVVLGERPDSMPEALTSVIASGESPPRDWSIVGPHRPYISSPTPPTRPALAGSRC